MQTEAQARESLKALYLRHWPAFWAYFQEHKDISPPLLISPPDEYFNQRIKLMVIGLETRGKAGNPGPGWYNNRIRQTPEVDAVEFLMCVYKNEYRLGLGGKSKSVFWPFVRELEKNLGITEGAIVWSNVNKVDQNGTSPSRTVRKAVRSIFPVLTEEISILAPDILVFLTKAYDKYLKRVFNGHFVEVPGCGQFLAKFIHAAPPFKSFRTAHPRWLERRGLSPTVLEKLKELAV